MVVIAVQVAVVSLVVVWLSPLFQTLEVVNKAGFLSCASHSYTECIWALEKPQTPTGEHYYYVYTLKPEW